MFQMNNKESILLVVNSLRPGKLLRPPPPPFKFFQPRGDVILRTAVSKAYQMRWTFWWAKFYPKRFKAF